MKKKVFSFIFLVCILGLVIQYRNNIIDFIMKNFIDKEVVSFGEANQYYKDFDYGFVQNTNNLYPSSRQDIMNIIYSTLNRGLDKITFYCADGYNNCINDVNDITSNDTLLSTINNMVHPFNSYHNIYFSINNYGKITITIKKNYSDSDILLINNKIDEITNSLFSSDTSDYNKIKLFHDYLVNTTYYDDTVSIENQLYIQTNSNNAMGLLFQNKAICSGYSDTMAIFLNKYGFNNYKISSSQHIWNLIYFDGSWKHIDVTWDDPISSDGRNILLHDFLLIDTNQLMDKESKLDKNDHNFDRSFYIEAN